MAYFFAGILVAILFNLVFSYFFDSPKDKILKRENGQMVLKYEIIQKRLNQISDVLTDLQNRDDNIYRAIFEAEPIPKSVREAGFGGINRYADLEGYESSEIVINSVKKLDMLSKKMYIQSKSYDEVIALAKNKGAMLSSLPAILPISNKDFSRISTGFGFKIHPIYKIKIFHPGLDFAALTGTEIYATGNGTVVIADRSFRGYGNHIVIDHGFGYKTLYGHMSAFNVRAGQKVKRGDVIGFVGNTGLSTGSHLHYEVWKEGAKVDPINYFYNDLTPEQYEQMIAISNNNGQSFD